MPRQDRVKTRYPGVYYVNGTCPATGKPDKVFYIRYRRDGKTVEEKAGRSSTNDMTAAKASNLRAERILGNDISNVEKRKVKESRWTINRLWVDYCEGKPLYKGKRSDQNRFEKYVQPSFGEMTPEEITPLDVERFKRRAITHLSDQSQKNTLELLRRLCNHGVNLGVCAGLGFKIKMPTPDNLQTEDLTREQLAALHKALDEHGNRDIADAVRFALLTGLRRGELATLEWEHVNLEQGFLVLKAPKGGRSQTVRMSAAALDLLKSRKAYKDETSRVFGNYNIDSFTHGARSICDKAGIPRDFRPLHGMRHTFASKLASSGQVDLFLLQKMLTHKTPSMTQRYAHLADEAMQRAADVAGDIFKQQPEQEPSKVVNLRPKKG